MDALVVGASPADRIPILDVGLIHMLRQRRVRVVGAVERFQGAEVVYGPVTHPKAPDLYFIGYTNPLSGNLREPCIDAEHRPGRRSANDSEAGPKRQRGVRA